MLFRRAIYYLSSIFALLTGFRQPFKVAAIFLGAQTGEDTVVQLRRSGLKFQVRGKMDVWSLKETLLDRFYQRFGFAVQDGWTVVDIGGGIGDYTVFAAHGHGHARVLAFEPFPASYDLLKVNLGLNAIENAQVFPQAVSNTAAALQFAGAAVDPLSLQTSTLPAAEPDASLSVPAVSLEAVLERSGSGAIDLLKLDCEGAEYDILLQAPAAALEKIERIVMEYHDSLTPYTHYDLVRHLTYHGFAVETWQNFAHADIGYLRAARKSGDVQP